MARLTCSAGTVGAWAIAAWNCVAACAKSPPLKAVTPAWNSFDPLAAALASVKSKSRSVPATNLMVSLMDW